MSWLACLGLCIIGMSNSLKSKKRPGLCCLQPCSHVDRQGGFSMRLNSCHARTSLCQKCPWRLCTAFEVGITSSRHWGTGEVGTASPPTCTRTAFPGKSFLDLKKKNVSSGFFWALRKTSPLRYLFLTHANDLVTGDPSDSIHTFLNDCCCPCNVIAKSKWNKKLPWKVTTSICILTLRWERCARASSRLTQKTKCFQGIKENCWGLLSVPILPMAYSFPCG